MMTPDVPIGLYIHIPFCLRKCRYCDFCSVANSTKELRAAYVERLTGEIRSSKPEGLHTVDTVFFGGGTPTLLTPSQLSMVMQAVHDTFDVSRQAEITVEANPATVTAEHLAAFRAEGINRVSLGSQSINENEQKILGRMHTSEDFYQSMRTLRSAGFDNINVDIMYGIPDQTRESFMRTVDAVLSVEPTHISAYSLILEEGTPLYDMRQNLTFPSEDEELLMHESLRERLSLHGFSRYEISNFCLDGYACRHNIKYWTMQPYLGFGAAAHSYVGHRRSANPSDLPSYIQGSAATVTELTQEDERFEYAMLALRMSCGLSLGDYRSRFGVAFEEGREALLSHYASMGFLVYDGDTVRFTDRGMYVSNSLLTEIL